MVSESVSVLVRLASGEAGREGGWWVVFVVEASAGGGVVSLVMADGTDLGREMREPKFRSIGYKNETCGEIRFQLELPCARPVFTAIAGRGARICAGRKWRPLFYGV